MAYDRYESRRDWREARPRWRDDDRDLRRERGSDRDRGSDERSWSARDREDRGWFERAGDEIASWFGDEDAERRRRREQPDRFSGQSHLRNEDDVQRFYGERERDRGGNRDLRREVGRDRAFMGDEDFGRFERSPRWRDEGYRRPYTGRSAERQGPGDFGPEAGERPYRPMTGDYGRGFEDRVEHGGSYYGVGAHHDRHYGEWRQRQIDELDRDYDEYRRENQSRFEDDFASWRERRQSKRQLLGQVREQMEVRRQRRRACRHRRPRRRRPPDPDQERSRQRRRPSFADVHGDRPDRGRQGDPRPRPPSRPSKQWRDESRDRALFEREDQGEAGPHMLNRSFSGTYR